jgi:hypothetical protein
MYLEMLDLGNIRTFDHSMISFIHPDMAFRSPGKDDPKNSKRLPRPKLPNVNLLLGDNASGKTTVLQAIALAALGPVARQVQLPFRRLVRYAPNGEIGTISEHQNQAYILASLYLHRQEGMENERFESMQQLERRGELESMEFAGIADEKIWAPIFESTNTAFFCIAYGSTRRVESADSPELGLRDKNMFERAQRVQSIFQDGFQLYRLSNWLPRLRKSIPGRHEEVAGLFEQIIGPGHFNFTGIVKDREYYFKRGQVSVPFPGLSDGYRGFIGWVGDLHYHLCYAHPHGGHLVDVPGIVMVDEIDLLLHPKWQMKVIKTVAKALPRMQFIFTSHSPLVAGSLEWMNINLLKVNPKTNRTIVKRLKQSIHGLDADQILLTDFFGLNTTRAASKRTKLDELARRAGQGDDQAAHALILAMARGEEAES